jgi:butyryl-CoA dehydrogenase
MSGDANGMLGHSYDYLDMFATLVLGWQWLNMAAAAQSAPISGDRKAAIEAAARYWMHTEVPRINVLSELCRTNESSYIDAKPEWF